MPAFDYEYGACGHTLEAFQPMSEAALAICPACFAAAPHRLISGGQTMTGKAR